ncbi:MAG: hypothetical protein DRJ63_04655 [Thermoprotei archaeon]|nr:MAG: hypothetical protein DRJ63_04655 [Thermoprotei archaeon]
MIDAIYVYLKEWDLDKVDLLSRKIAEKTYLSKISKLSEDEVYSLIDEITGGLGYRKGDFNVMRMGYCGSLIAWPEVIPEGGRVLEIGTGIGRTCYAAVEWAKPSLFLTLDNSPEILAVALYRNPVEAFSRALKRSIVRIALIDAVKAVNIISAKFDHIIHDGGPNPGKNPRIYSKEFLEKLSQLLKPNGTLSIFAGRNKKWQDKIYSILKSLGFAVEAVSFPGTPTLVFHASMK